MTHVNASEGGAASGDRSATPKTASATRASAQSGLGARSESQLRAVAQGSSLTRRRGVAKNVAVMALSAGIVATLALPAYAFAPHAANAGAEGSTALTDLTLGEAQNVIVAADAAAETAARDGFTATTPEELAERERQRVLEEQRTAQLSSLSASTSYSGLSASDYLAAPPYPSFSLDQVVAVAHQYTGVPYVYGGSTPAGFDCSGFTMYVYAQFGVALPHSATRQGAMGTRISPADALPGDLVVIDGGAHIGIYLGNGRMIDAPFPGRTVGNHAIYSSNHYFVRVGI